MTTNTTAGIARNSPPPENYPGDLAGYAIALSVYIGSLGIEVKDRTWTLEELRIPCNPSEAKFRTMTKRQLTAWTDAATSAMFDAEYGITDDDYDL